MSKKIADALRDLADDIESGEVSVQDAQVTPITREVTHMKELETEVRIVGKRVDIEARYKQSRSPGE